MITTEGVLHKKMPINNKNPQYPKQEFIIRISNNFTNKNGEIIERSFPRKFVLDNQKKILDLEKFKIGTKIKVDWFLHGYEWMGEDMKEAKVTNVDNAWKITKNTDEETIAFHAAPELDDHAQNIDANSTSVDDTPF